MRQILSGKLANLSDVALTVLELKAQNNAQDIKNNENIRNIKKALDRTVVTHKAKGKKAETNVAAVRALCVGFRCTQSLFRVSLTKTS
eukprot:6698294-Pyramimonas_sp.AAC.1